MTKWEIVESDALEGLRALPSESVDACLTDPPYGLGNREPTPAEIIAYINGERLDTGGDFMSKRWDLPPVGVWLELMRVLKPGAFALVFGGTRMFDLLTLGLRIAGFEVRDCLIWLHGMGFPKSLDVSKAIDKHLGAEREIVGKQGIPGSQLQRMSDVTGQTDKGHRWTGNVLGGPVTPQAEAWDDYGTALKPGWEPCVLVRKPLAGTVAGTALAHGVGALNIGGTRLGWESDKPSQDEWNRMGASGQAGANGFAGQFSQKLKDAYAAGAIEVPDGRWPPNVMLSHTPDCVRVGTRKVRTGTAVKRHGVTAGHIFGAIGEHPEGTPDATYADADGKEEIEDWACAPGCPVAMLDEQSGDRPSGIAVTRNGGGGRIHQGISGKQVEGYSNSPRPDSGYADSGGASRFFFVAKASRSEREFGCEEMPPNDDGIRNYHPTVKPIGLAKWLCKLLLPPAREYGPPRRLLIPYSGSGSEMIGAMRAGWDEVVGIQRIHKPDGTINPEEAAYVAIAKARLTRWSQVRIDMDEAEACGATTYTKIAAESRQMSLLGDILKGG